MQKLQVRLLGCQSPDMDDGWHCCCCCLRWAPVVREESDRGTRRGRFLVLFRWGRSLS